MNQNFVIKIKSDNRQLQLRVILILGEDQQPQPLYLYPCPVKLESSAKGKMQNACEDYQDYHNFQHSTMTSMKLRRHNSEEDVSMQQ